MPLYEYFCPQCEKRFEKIVRFLQHETECPTCSQLSRKVFSTFRTGGSSKGGGGSGCGTCSSSSCSSCG